MPARNPLLAPPSCPTGWDNLPSMAGGYLGYSEMALLAADVVRELPRSPGPPAAVSRLYTGRGQIAGLVTDGGERLLLPDTTPTGHLLADLAGVAMLRGRVPWSGAQGPVALPQDSAWRRLGLHQYPYSVISRVLITAGGPGELMAAVVLARQPDIVREYLGMPVLCLPWRSFGIPDTAGLEAVRWPEGVIATALTPELAEDVSEVVFEVDAEPWPA